MPVASRGMVNGQRAKLKAIQDIGDKQILVAFAGAHMAASPQMAQFTREYAAELQRVRGAAIHAGDTEDSPDTPEGDPNATVSLLWLHTSGALKRLTDVVQSAVTAAAKASAAAAKQAQEDATLAGLLAGVALVKMAQHPSKRGVPVNLGPPPGPQKGAGGGATTGAPTPRATSSNTPLTKDQALALLAQAQALDDQLVNQQAADDENLGVDETVDPGQGETEDGDAILLGQQAASATRNSAVSGVVAGLASQAMQQALMMGIQGALTSALTDERNGAADAFGQMVNLTITQNPDLVSGWVWVCTYQNSCIACIEMDGSVHGNDEDLSSHLNCACFQAALNGPLPDDFMTGDQWFNQQDDIVQEEILGPSKYLAWKSGDVQLMDFIDSHTGYISERSLKSLGLDYRDYLLQLPRASDYSAAEIQAAMDAATAQMRVVEALPAEVEAELAGMLAEAPQWPEIPGMGEGAAAEAKVEEAATAAIESPAVQQMRADRATLQDQRDAIQAKQDVLSAKWRDLVLKQGALDPEEEQAAIAKMEKQIAGVEKSQAANIKRMDKLDAKMAKIDEKLPTAPVATEVQTVADTAITEAKNAAATTEQAAARDALFPENMTALQNEMFTRLTGEIGDNPDFAHFADRMQEQYGQNWAFPVKTPEDAIQKIYGVYHSEYGEDLSPLTVALQQAAQQEFGSATVIRGDEEIISEAATQWGDVIPGIRVLLRQMYDDTQAALSEAGVSEVTLYRGIHRIEASLETELRQPIASMTVDRARAEVYARVTADRPYVAVEEVTIPASQILSTGSTGFGFNNIGEVVILGADPEVAAAEAAKAAEDVAQAAAAGDMGANVLTYTLPEIDQQAEAAIIQQAQDVLASADGVASHTDALELGGPIRDYINERIGPLADYGQEAFAMRGVPLGDLTPEQIAWYKGDTSQHGGLTFHEAEQQYAAAQRDETLRLLQQARDLGGEDLALADGTDEVLADVLTQAQDVFPSDWLTASNDQGELKVIQPEGQQQRGYYRPDKMSGDGTLALRYIEGETDPQRFYQAAIHELGHRMEDSVDGIWLLEKEFYDARTAGEDLVDLDPKFLVAGKTKIDQWAMEYLGKDPILSMRSAGFTDAAGDRLRSVRGYELLSNGLEWLLGADPRGAYFLAQDEEFHQWLLGLLFGAKDHTI
jgi:hypothetical protein